MRRSLPALARAVLVLVFTGASASACTPTPTPTPSPLPEAFLPVELTGVGGIPAGRTSIPGMTIQLTEVDVATIERGTGSMTITLTDADGGSDTIRMIGTPEIVAPGSLGIEVTLSAQNALLVSIVDSDPLNVEQVTISRLRLAAAANAPPGAIGATITECTGSLAGCAPSRVLASPGTVSAR